jgi:hypothetical protein
MRKTRTGAALDSLMDAYEDVTEDAPEASAS